MEVTDVRTQAYVVKATGVDDVQAAVEFAAKNNIALNIKSTGHSFLGRYVVNQL